MFTLDEKHLDAAKKIAADHRKKRSCDTCYERGWIGVSEQNLLVLCTRCVDLDAAMVDWKEYVSGHEELKEHFSELFKEGEEELESEEHPAQAIYENKKSHPVGKTAHVPGPKRTGRAKKI
ncbi:MAG TPA: hypothetical protein GXX77_07760 [Candidatus Cloacimonetes bacterium]|nr:hypothetical protein [Candidatus Cloacimonadota bacterium]